MEEYGLVLALLGIWCLVSILSPNPAHAGDFYVPDSISKAAQKYIRLCTLAERNIPFPQSDDFAGWEKKRADTEAYFAQINAEVLERFSPEIVKRTLGGVPVLDIKPKSWKPGERVLVYTHGGYYTLFTAQSTLVCSVPLAQDTGLRVIAVDYTPAPVAKWREILEQSTSVVRALIKEGQKLSALAICGDSAGGALAAATALNMRDKGLGMPGAVVLWAPWADITSCGDTRMTLQDADPMLTPSFGIMENCANAYAAPEEQMLSYVSPVYADYTRGFPPTLIQAGTKEILLSDAVRLYRALAQADIPVVFDPYEGMWHVFQGFPGNLPESETARDMVRKFLDAHLSS